MNYAVLIDFVKKNGGAAVAIVLMYIYTGKLETRLDKVEGKLFDCYTTRTATTTQNNQRSLTKVVQLYAVLPENRSNYEKKKQRRA
jgi:hypothetical protein